MVKVNRLPVTGNSCYRKSIAESLEKTSYRIQTDYNTGLATLNITSIVFDLP